MRSRTSHWIAVHFARSGVGEDGGGWVLLKCIENDSIRLADLLLRLGRLDEAQTSYYGLVEENPESFAFVHGLLSAKGLPKNVEGMSKGGV